jgi:hypothetical protein
MIILVMNKKNLYFIVILNIIFIYGNCNKETFSLLDRSSSLLQKQFIQNQQYRINNVMQNFNFLQFNNNIPKWLGFKSIFSFSSKNYYRQIVVHIKKKQGINIIQTYNRIILLEKIYLLQQEEINLYNEQLQEITAYNTLQDVDNYIQKLNIKIHKIKLEKDMNYKERKKYIQQLKFLCNLSYIHKNFIVPFYSFEKKNILLYIASSFFYKKNSYALQDLLGKKKSFFFFNQSIETKNKNFTNLSNQISLNAKNTIDVNLEIKLLRYKIKNTIYKKNIRINNFYKSLVLLKEQKQQQQNLLSLLQNRLNLLIKVKNLQHIIEIHHKQSKILEIKTKILQQQYMSVIFIWSIFLELSPLDSCQYIYEIPESF